MFIILKSNYNHKEAMSSLCFSSSKFVLIFFTIFLFSGCSVTSANHTNKILLPTTINLNDKNKFPSSPRKVLIHDNNLLICFDNGSIAQWDINTFKISKVFKEADNYPIKSFLKLNNELLVGSSNMKLSSYLLDTAEKLNEKDFDKGSILSIIQVDNNIIVAFGSSDISVIDLKNYEILDTKKEHDYLVYTLYYEENGKKLYSGSDDNTIIVWNLVNNSFLKKVSQIKDFDSSVRHILKLKSNIVVTTGNGKVYLYDELLKDLLDTSKYHKSSIVSAKIDQDTLIIGDSSGIVSSWCIANNSMILNKTIKIGSSIRSLNILDDKVLIFSKNGKIITSDLFCKDDK